MGRQACQPIRCKRIGVHTYQGCKPVRPQAKRSAAAGLQQGRSNRATTAAGTQQGCNRDAMGMQLGRSEGAYGGEPIGCKRIGVHTYQGCKPVGRQAKRSASVWASLYGCMPSVRKRMGKPIRLHSTDRLSHGPMDFRGRARKRRL